MNRPLKTGGSFLRATNVEVEFDPGSSMKYRVVLLKAFFYQIGRVNNEGVSVKKLSGANREE
jgi:hypothetical protein